jgi:copper chaperone
MCTATLSAHDLGLSDKNHACACSASAGDALDSHSDSSVTEATVVREHHVVQGMTCSHCVASVTEELSAIDGVLSVSVDLNAGGASRVMVISNNPIAIDEIRGAVAEAGYELATG